MLMCLVVRSSAAASRPSRPLPHPLHNFEPPDFLDGALRASRAAAVVAAAATAVAAAPAALAGPSTPPPHVVSHARPAEALAHHRATAWDRGAAITAAAAAARQSPPATAVASTRSGDGSCCRCRCCCRRRCRCPLALASRPDAGVGSRHPRARVPARGSSSQAWRRLKQGLSTIRLRIGGTGWPSTVTAPMSVSVGPLT